MQAQVPLTDETAHENPGRSREKFGYRQDIIRADSDIPHASVNINQHSGKILRLESRVAQLKAAIVD